MKTEKLPDSSRHQQLLTHQQALSSCVRCPDMKGPVITGEAVVSPVMLIGQAPGIHEAEVQKPFGWTAGKTLFSWFESIGLQEDEFRRCIYMAAVCRCFPGKQMNKQGKTGGDRVPSALEISQCRPWLNREIELLRPSLIIPVGKLAISQFMTVDKLATVIGTTHSERIKAHQTDIIPLPHPSGASTWHRMEPGKSLLKKALKELAAHPAWANVLDMKKTHKDRRY